jgi:hypothetical protein
LYKEVREKSRILCIIPLDLHGRISIGKRLQAEDVPRRMMLRQRVQLASPYASL